MDLLDRATGEEEGQGEVEAEAYKYCLINIPAFAIQFTKAFQDYHYTPEDYIADSPDRYTVHAEGAD